MSTISAVAYEELVKEKDNVDTDTEQTENNK